MSEENKQLYTHTIKVRIDDINYGNHLCHSKFVSMLHDARAQFLMKNDLSEINCFGLGLIILNLNINYCSECFLGDELEIKLFLKNLENVKIEFAYIIFNHTTKKIAAKAETLMSFYIKEKSKLARVPEAFKTLMKSASKLSQ